LSSSGIRLSKTLFLNKNQCIRYVEKDFLMEVWKRMQIKPLSPMEASRVLFCSPIFEFCGDLGMSLDLASPLRSGVDVLNSIGSGSE